MANFSTHRNIGVITSVLTTSALVFSGNIVAGDLSSYFKVPLDYSFSITTIILMIIFGTLGSLFPDIDLKTAIPAKYMRIFLGFLLSVISFSFIISHKIDILQQIKISEDYFILLAIFSSIIISLIIIFLIQSLMVHRGVVHSIPFGVLSSIILYEGFKLIDSLYNFVSVNPLMISILFFVGFLTHLILDEIYSIDLLGARIKKSFGTALKLIDKNNIIGSLVIWLLIVIYFFNFN